MCNRRYSLCEPVIIDHFFDSLQPPFQNESKVKSFGVNIIIKVGLIIITKIWHVNTLSERDRGELGNGLSDR